MPTFHLLIKGKVQGVCYRAGAKDKATELSLTGWVKNTAAGDVEAIVTGPQPAIQHFIAWCRQGPPAAEVKEVQVEPMPATAFADFTITRR
ncbi:MAG: acylphosphatase [Bacteroidetes bacterium]|nr:acylphosphatase [Bacteroidota bacterium]